MVEKIKNPPKASSFMEASRSFGNYDLPAALADLIDNSITAGADQISIDCDYNSVNPYVRIADNGVGMSRSKLIEAMQFASRSPLEDRERNDLGRFGMGLKSASFSQARELTVISQMDGKFCGARWDLDNNADWEMNFFSDSEAKNLSVECAEFNPTTEVIWKKLTRLTESDNLEEKDFNRLIVEAADQLSLIFHRFLELKQPPNKKRIKIFLNGELLTSNDPFKRDHPKTQQLEEEKIRINDEIITITPYILPIFSSLAADEYEKLAGKEGYLKNQGFYVYRERRLIIYGTWFKLVRHDELSKLARVRVDIPNSLDEQWRITVDKSDAQIPTMIKRRLRDLTVRIRNSSTRVYRRRGASLNRTDITPIWERKIHNHIIKYNVNKNHDMIKTFIQTIPADQKQIFSRLLEIIADSLPIEGFYSDWAESSQKFAQGQTIPEAMIGDIKYLASVLLSKGMDQSDFLNSLRTMEPYNTHYDFILDVLKREGVIR